MAAESSRSGQASLSPTERQDLIKLLNELPGAQFGEILTSLKPDGGIVPGSSAAQGQRSTSLIEWVEGPTGPGLQAMLEVMSTLTWADPNSSGLNTVQTLLHKVSRNFAAEGGQSCTQPGTQKRWNNPETHSKYLIGRDDFLSRDKKLGKLDQVLHKNSTIEATFINGIGGVGKSELARHYAKNYKDEYPGGICYLELRNTNDDGNDLGTAILRFVEEFYPEIKPGNLSSGGNESLLQKVEHCWRNWPGEGEVLVVVDNVENYEEIEDYLIIPIRNKRFKVLVNLLKPLQIKKTEPRESIQLNPLEEGSALELLSEYIEEKVESDRVEAQALCKDLGCLPLALELIGKYMKKYPKRSLRKVRKTLEDIRNKVYQDSELSDRMYNDVFSLSWEQLGEEDKKLGCLFGLFSIAPIHLTLIKELLKIIHEDFYEQDFEDFFEDFNDIISEELMNLGLVFYKDCKDADERIYELHAIIQRFLEKKLEEEWQPPEKLEKLREKFCQVMVKEARKISATPTCEEKEAAELSIYHIRKVANKMQDCLEPSKIPKIIEIYLGLGRFDEGNGIYDKAKEWCKKYLEMVKKGSLEKGSPSFVKAQNSLAHINLLQENYSAAEQLYSEAYEKGSAWFDKKKNSLQEEEAFEARRNILQSQDGWGYLLCLSPYEKTIKKKKDLLEIDLKKAKDLLKSALNERKCLLGETHLDLAQSHQHLGYLFQHEKNWDKAEVYYSKSLEIRKKLLYQNQQKEHPIVVETYYNLGTYYYNRATDFDNKEAGKDNLLSKSKDFLRLALKYYGKFYGDGHYNIALASITLARVYLERDFSDVERLCEVKKLCDKALKIIESILETIQSLGVPSLKLEYYNVKLEYFNILTRLYHSERDYTNAKFYCDRGLAFAEESNLNPGILKVAEEKISSCEEESKRSKNL